MTENKKSQIANGDKTQQRATQPNVKSEDIGQVLEYVSSQFRWEILDVPLSELKKPSVTG